MFLPKPSTPPKALGARDLSFKEWHKENCPFVTLPYLPPGREPGPCTGGWHGDPDSSPVRYYVTKQVVQAPFAGKSCHAVYREAGGILPEEY